MKRCSPPEVDYLYGAPMADATPRALGLAARSCVRAAGERGAHHHRRGVDRRRPQHRRSQPTRRRQPRRPRSTRKAASYAEVVLSFAGQRRTERALFDAERARFVATRSVGARQRLVAPRRFYAALRRPATASLPRAPRTTPGGRHRTNGTHRAGVQDQARAGRAASWTSAVGEQPDGTTNARQCAIDKVVSACDLTTNAQLISCDLKVPRAGYFVLRASATDPRGNNVRASTQPYGTEEAPRAQPLRGPLDDRHGIKLEANQEAVRARRHREVLLRSPFKRAKRW